MSNETFLAPNVGPVVLLTGYSGPLDQNPPALSAFCPFMICHIVLVCLVLFFFIVRVIFLFF